MAKKKINEQKSKEDSVGPVLPHFKLTAVASLVNCSERHVREEVKRGNLRAFKPGKELIFFQEDIDKWIRRKAV